MTEPSRPSLDHGLFLGHFERGKACYDEGGFGEAERELEEAYLIRPRDPKVLNLLGLVYFKQQKLEKAEEVYRKLAAESPEVATLFYNLGLIYNKLGRLEEAEVAFLKSLTLAPGNAKVHFYLGSIYEGLRRFQDAIFQYRQAGAAMLVRRVEGKIASTPGAPAPPPPAPAPAAKRMADLGDDTAEFKTTDVQSYLKRPAAEVFPTDRKREPLGPAVLAPGGPAGPDTARYLASETAAVGPAPASPSVSLPTHRTQPVNQADVARALEGERKTAPHPAIGGPFRLLKESLVEVSFSGKLFIKQGTIYSYTGNLTFWVKERRPGGTSALVIVTGTGKAILKDRDREVTLVRVLAGDSLHVEPSHLLACEQTLTPRYLGLSESGPEALALDGDGLAALSLASKPMELSITPDYPVSVPWESIASWSGEVKASVVDDPNLREAMLSAEGQQGALVRLEGTGRVLVEQGLD